jgi:hypothetical protein
MKPRRLLSSLRRILMDTSIQTQPREGVVEFTNTVKKQTQTFEVASRVPDYRVAPINTVPLNSIMLYNPFVFSSLIQYKAL